ncbi:DUF3306 domain-containing protein [uncultured Vibrio sp.]|uniref:DUF3306 domain-containing protein n=1 Tax=uncultured Vibrio sp. TaxID=114054 RepID=UPI00091AB051|nr:DUF3306 domain-containing protein [uncultured Vibrio sp.]OIQ26329.1 MAG: hypothetical protein BM561_00770 [Vibrio sp. MedPE-SWchi]
MANNFLSRWSQRKLTEDSAEPCAQEVVSSQDDESQSKEDTIVEAKYNDQQDAPSDTEASAKDHSGESAEKSEDEISIASMLTSDIDPLVKKAALRKLFLSEEFNQVDALNDYDHDYSAVKSLTSDVAQSLREWMKPSENDGEDEAIAEGNNPDLSPETGQYESKEEGLEEGSIQDSGEVESSMTDASKPNAQAHIEEQNQPLK